MRGKKFLFGRKAGKKGKGLQGAPENISSKERGKEFLSRKKPGKKEGLWKQETGRLMANQESRQLPRKQKKNRGKCGERKH